VGLTGICGFNPRPHPAKVTKELLVLFFSKKTDILRRNFFRCYIRPM